VDALLRRLVRTGLRHGMAGDHWSWLALALAAFVLRRARRPAADRVVSLSVQPGERYLVTLSEPPERR
jgi:hypothetical protein